LTSWVSFCALVTHTPSLERQPRLVVEQSLPYSADLAFLLVCLHPMVRAEAQWGLHLLVGPQVKHWRRMAVVAGLAAEAQYIAPQIPGNSSS
jgi:hypothetical protein